MADNRPLAATGPIDRAHRDDVEPQQSNSSLSASQRGSHIEVRVP
jgi:hypothetical protein